jgi:ribosomal protein S18 acetylase RimI-like enzyme
MPTPMTTHGESQRFRIRPMTRAEVDLAIDWAAAEGWNPGLHDAACFHAADPDGFLVGLVDDEPVATISVVRYGTSFGFLGLYIVAPAYRGRGHGLSIWNAGLAHLRGRVVGLDGVVAQQPNYRRSGFALAYRNVRWQGAAHAAVADPRIVALASVPFDAVEAFDRALFPAERNRFLQCWIRPPQGAALGIVDDGRLAGYGVIRAARNGFKIGPLGADDPALAEALFDALITRVPQRSAVYLDTPQPNRAAVALVERRGMTPVFETARMYAGVAPDTPLDRLFGVTTFELG